MNDAKPQPKWVDGEPVCSDECDYYKKVSDVDSSWCEYPDCRMQCPRGLPCWPAIREQRDDALLEVMWQKSEREIGQELAIRYANESDDWKARFDALWDYREDWCPPWNVEGLDTCLRDKDHIRDCRKCWTELPIDKEKK